MLSQSQSSPLASVADGANPLVYKLQRKLSCGAKENYSNYYALTSAGWASNPNEKWALTIGQKKRRLTVMVQVNSKGETVVETMNFAWAGTISFQHT